MLDFAFRTGATTSCAWTGEARQLSVWIWIVLFESAVGPHPVSSTARGMGRRLRVRIGWALRRRDLQGKKKHVHSVRGTEHAFRHIRVPTRWSLVPGLTSGARARAEGRGVAVGLRRPVRVPPSKYPRRFGRGTGGLKCWTERGPAMRCKPTFFGRPRVDALDGALLIFSNYVRLCAGRRDAKWPKLKLVWTCLASLLGFFGALRGSIIIYRCSEKSGLAVCCGRL